MSSKLLKRVRSASSLEAAWRAVRANGRFSKSELVRSEIEAFSLDAEKKLRSLQRGLARGVFKFKAARGIPLKKASGDGIRPIVLAPVESRIVQRALLEELQRVKKLQPFFRNPHSFGGIRRKKDDGLTAVPGAVGAVLEAIKGGRGFVVCADISGFFTKVSKSHVIDIISSAVEDAEFSTFLHEAVKVELSNLEKLRENASYFPTEDLGIAQGSSLSPLFGNIILHEFDAVMNEGDCVCIRYIDDFVILAPSKVAAAARLRRSRKLLSALGMDLSKSKTTAPCSIKEGFDFLGVRIMSGLVRPTQKARTKFLASLRSLCDESRKSFVGFRNGQELDRNFALLQTLRKMDRGIQGWGKHYRFCNDKLFMENVDKDIDKIIRTYLGVYAETRKSSPSDAARQLLGVERLQDLELYGVWPKAVETGTIRQR